MTWLFWVFFVMFAVFVIQGLRKGLMHTAIMMAGSLIILILAAIMNPAISDFLRTHTSWETSIEEKCKEMLQGEEGFNPGSGEHQELVIDELPIPQTLKKQLKKNNTVQAYEQMAVENFTDYLSEYIAHAMVNAIAFVLAFVLANMLLRIIVFLVDLVMELPVLDTLNRIGGGLLGAVQGLLWIWVILLIIALLCNTGPGKALIHTIRKDAFLNWVYNHNFLMNVGRNILAGK